MIKRLAMLATALSVMATRLAAAAGDSGTGAVAEMEISVGQFGILAGGAVALGVITWLVVRILNR